MPFYRYGLRPGLFSCANTSHDLFAGHIILLSWALGPVVKPCPSGGEKSAVAAEAQYIMLERLSRIILLILCDFKLTHYLCAYLLDRTQADE